MFNAHRRLRHETLESRQMLSVNVGIVDNTIEVTSFDGSDDMVEIRRNGFNRLRITDHGAVVDNINLNQFGGTWNLYVNLDGGDDSLTIKNIRRGLNSLRVDTGGQLGTVDLSNTDNDRVVLRNVKANGISIDTGATVGGYENPTYEWFEPYQDNDFVKLLEVTSNIVDIETGVEVHMGVMPYETPDVQAVEVDEEYGNQIEDNDRVRVIDSWVLGGDLSIDTGANVVATVWHDHEVPVVEAQYEEGWLMYLRDDDNVFVSYTCVYGGCIHIDTGADVQVFEASDDSSQEPYDGDPRNLQIHVSDQDVVEMAHISMFKYDSYAYDYASKNDAEPCEEDCEPGSVYIDTGANINNSDPYVYLDAEVNDDDLVKLLDVHVANSLYINTGLNTGSMVGDPTQSSSDRDRVILRYLKQKDSNGVTNVDLGQDDDYLRIHRSVFRGYAMFDGGEGENTKSVSMTSFRSGSDFINFDV